MSLKVTIVIRDYGYAEGRDGEILQGFIGSYFDPLLKQLGRTREDFNIVPLSQLDKLPETNVIIGMGEEVLNALTPYKGIDKWRGSILLTSNEGIKFIPTLDPELFTKGGMAGDGVPVRPIMLWDLKRALMESDYPEIRRKPRSHTVLRTVDDVVKVLTSLDLTKPISVDIETECGAISCIGIATSPTCSIVIPFISESGTQWKYDDERVIINVIRATLEKSKIIGQNFSYDMAWLKREWGIDCTENIIFDTYVARHVVYPELPGKLSFMTSIFTDIAYYKDDGKEHSKVRDYGKLWAYNANDTMATYECYQRLDEEIHFSDKRKLFDFEMRLTRHLFEISRRGITFDGKARNKMRADYRKRMDQQVEEIRSIVGSEINPNSDKQLKDYVYGTLGIKPINNRKTGNPTLDYLALLKLGAKYPQKKFFPLMIEYNKDSKLYSNYLSVKPDDDGKIRCSYGWAETGRLRSSESPFRTGTNLQNIPPSMRVLFIPDVGRLFVEADLSQADARIVAYSSGDENYIKLFESREDAHKRNASNIFNIPIDSVSNKERQLGKKISHATNYGMGPRTMCENIIRELGMEYAISEGEAKKFQANYFNAYPDVRRWQERIRNQLKENRTLVNCLGRSRYFMAPWGDSLFKEAYAWEPQSTVADLINMGIDNWISSGMDKRHPILLQVHDSVLFHWDETHAVIKDGVKKYFEIPLWLNNREVVIPIELKTSTVNWGSMK